MITGSELYWILVLDGVCGVMVGAIVLGVIAVVLSVIAVIISISDDELNKKIPIILLVASVLWVVFFSIALALTPNSKQMAMIKVVPMIANSEIMQELPGDAKELYRLGIDAAKGYLEGAQY